MSNQLIDHCPTKFSRVGVIVSSAGRNWAGVYAERRRHLAGELPPFLSVVTEITYAVDGNPDAVVHRNGSGRTQATPVQPGTIWICPEAVLETKTRITGELPDILHVCLPSSLFRSLGDEAFPRLTERSLRYEAAVNDPLIGYMLSALATELAHETTSGGLLVECIALALRTRLALRCANDSASRALIQRDGPALDAKRLRRVLEFIEANLEDNISVEKLSQVACLSQFHFSRAFRRATGKAPHAFLSEKRLERAKSLIREGTRSLTDIAFSCSFSTQASFTKAFSKAVGVAPGRYRATQA